MTHPINLKLRDDFARIFQPSAEGLEVTEGSGILKSNQDLELPDHIRINPEDGKDGLLG